MTPRTICRRFSRWVNDAPIGHVVIAKLSRRQVDAWRAGLAATPVVVDPHAEEPRTRPRGASSVNRDCAALNYAHDVGDVTTDMAWRVALRPTKGAYGRRTVYLDREQRRKLISCVNPDFVEFVKGMTHLPLRPSALAALTVGQFDKRHGVLSIGKDKAGQDRRIKLPKFTSEVLAKLATDKLPAAPLFAQASGKAWNKDARKKPMKEAAAAAGLAPRTVLYTLRHSTITDLVVDGLDLLAVALLSGTSIEMIEKHYGHLREDHAAEALAKLGL